MAEFKLDRIDRKILRELSRDGRISNTQLAQNVGLSASPCWQRVRRLEELGIIDSYRAILDQSQLGAAETVMIEVVLDRHDDETLEIFGTQMQIIPEVLEVHLTTGEYDYLTANWPELAAFIDEHLALPHSLPTARLLTP